MRTLVVTRQYSSPTDGRWGGLFDVSFTEMLGFEQAPCYDGEHGFSNNEFLSFISKYNIQNYDDAVTLIYEQYTGETKSDSSSEDDSFGSDSEDYANSDSEDDSTNSSFKSFSLFRRTSQSAKAVKKPSEMVTLTRWFGVFIPSENALYLESPSSALHSDCLTDILDVAECIQCFKVFIGIPRNRLDVVKRYLFAGFEISKKGQLQKQSAASMNQEMKGGAAATQNHILLEYEL